MKQHFSKQWLRQFGEASILHLTETFSDSAIFIVDHTQSIVYWSEGAERLLGFKAEEVLGQHCLKGIRCLQCIKGCGLQQFESIKAVKLEMHTKSGESLFVHKHAQAFIDSAGEFAGGIEILTPIQQKNQPAQFFGTTFHHMVTQSPAMRKLFEHVRSVAKTDVPVLARGESGTGKELIAKAIHLESERRDKPFIAVNCSAIPENLIESELFGHAKGAFTGAHQDRKGLFEQAHMGSLFLDEIAELPMTLQAKLLRVLETQRFKRVGENNEIHVDVRIITATHKSLRDAVNEGTFRQDLMYRLRVVPLFIPALRNRPEDIELLLQHFINIGNDHHEHQILAIDSAAREVLLQHPWPGNVREIRNIVDYAFAIGCNDTLTLDCLPPEFSDKHDGTPPTMPYSSAQTTVSPSTTATHSNTIFSEKDRILQALQHCNHNLGAAAKLLEISRATLWRKRKQYDI